MNRQLWERLTRLEARLNPESMSPLIIVTEALPPEQKVGLTVSRRVVIDEYKSQGLVTLARERITSKPNDDGRRCAPTGYAEDVIRDIHRNCCYRNNDGFCRICADTPVAGT